MKDWTPEPPAEERFSRPNEQNGKKQKPMNEPKIETALTIENVESYYIRRVESLTLARVVADLRGIREHAQVTVDDLDKLIEKVSVDVAEQRDGAFTAAVLRIQEIARQARRSGP